MNKPKVLFLCSGNTARSQMAEAFLRKYAGEYFDVYSAGLEPGELNPFTIKVMDEVGIDMSNHYAKGLEQFFMKVNFAYMITVCDRAEKSCPVFPGMGKRVFWPIEDPAAFDGPDDGKIITFRKTRDEISVRVMDWLHELGIQPAD